MNNLNKIHGYFNVLKKISVFLAGIALFGMFFFITIDVLLRNFFTSSIPGSYEIVQNYFMTLASFSVIVYAYSSGIMPRISMVVEKLPYKVQKLLNVIMLLVEFVIIILITYYTFHYALEGTSTGQSFSAVGKLFPLYPFLYLVPFGFGSIAIEIIFVLLKNLFNKEVWITFDKNQNGTVTDQPYVS